MATPYVAKRRQGRQKLSRVTYIHHVAWGIVCLLLFISLAGVWVYAQSQKGKVDSLEQQLVAAKRSVPSTCKVLGNWQSNGTKTLLANQREFLVHVPADFVPNQYYPLILFYPGKGATAEGAQAAYGLDSLPAIVVYPSPTIGKDGYSAWQSAPYSSNADDVGFTAAILDKLQSELCIDRTRVYAAGMSNGGGFASLLSCRLPDRFAAYAIVAGALYSPMSNCTPPKSAPIITIHGDSDPIVPYNGSLTRKLPPIYTWTAKRAALDKCNESATINPDAVTLITEWKGCVSGTTVQNIRILGGGHAWGQVPNDMLWQFLSRFSL